MPLQRNAVSHGAALSLLTPAAEWTPTGAPAWAPGHGHLNPRYATANADSNLERTRFNSALMRV